MASIDLKLSRAAACDSSARLGRAVPQVLGSTTVTLYGAVARQDDERVSHRKVYKADRACSPTLSLEVGHLRFTELDGC